MKPSRRSPGWIIPTSSSRSSTTTPPVASPAYKGGRHHRRGLRRRTRVPARHRAPLRRSPRRLSSRAEFLRTPKSRDDEGTVRKALRTSRSETALALVAVLAAVAMMVRSPNVAPLLLGVHRHELAPRAGGHGVACGDGHAGDARRDGAVGTCDPHAHAHALRTVAAAGFEPMRGSFDLSDRAMHEGAADQVATQVRFAANDHTGERAVGGVHHSLPRSKRWLGGRFAVNRPPSRAPIRPGRTDRGS